MASRRLVPASVRASLLGIPSDIGSLERNYVLPDEDLELIATRRRPGNRLGLAIHIALLRHPGQGWIDGIEPPAPLVAWLAEQVDVSSARGTLGLPIERDRYFRARHGLAVYARAARTEGRITESDGALEAAHAALANERSGRNATLDP